MLADTALLKSQIGTTLMDTELGIHRSPETVAGPKEVIEAAIRVARQNLTGRRRRDLRINDLYQPVGQSVDLERLEQLPSFRLFVEEVQNVLTALNLRP